MRIGLFGGAFDPVHIGHIELAELARKYYKLNKIIFIPSGMSGKSPHKKNHPVASGEHRVRMLKHSFENKKYFTVSFYELKKKGVSYTYQMINHFRKTKNILYFIIGMDSLFDIKAWKKGLNLLDLCKFIVGERKGFNIEKIPNRSPTEKILKHRNLLFLPGDIHCVSSSEIRKKIRNGISIKNLVHKKVYSYIINNNLYKNNL